MLSSEKETSEYSKTASFSLAIFSKSFLKIADIFDDVSLNRLIEVKKLHFMLNQEKSPLLSFEVRSDVIFSQSGATVP